MVVTALAKAFAKEVGKRAGGLLRRIDNEWRGRVRLMASDLIDEGISAEAYVVFVCERIRRIRRREPYSNEVFSLAWLKVYRKNATSYIELPTYVCTPARRRKHEERILACLLRPAPTT